MVEFMDMCLSQRPSSYFLENMIKYYIDCQSYDYDIIMQFLHGVEHMPKGIRLRGICLRV